MPALGATPFFVLTAGFFIIGAAFVSLLLIYRLNIPDKAAGAVYLSLWAVTTLVLNYGCFSPLTSAHTLLIPLIVWIFLKEKQAKKTPQLKGRNNRLLLFFLALAVTGSCFLFKGDRGMFLRTRDYLLLSNPGGQIVNQWYYTYSPHASQALKSTAEKTTGHQNPSSGNQAPPDNMVIFRSLCLAGLMVGLPFLLFGLFFLFSCFLFVRIMPGIIPQRLSDIFAAFLTTAAAIFLLFYLTPMEIGSDRKSIEQGLNGNSPRTRIETLRVIMSNQGDIFDFASRKKLDELARSTAPERYWLAMVLGISRDKQSIPLLEHLVRTESINVQCAALKALGKKGGTLPHLIMRDKIKNSPHWYVQQTALKALKKSS